jgi:GAF domain-containing protein
MQQTQKIFLSYRREDSAAAAGRLSDRLVLELGDSSVFMDVDGIPYGVDFVERLEKEVASCNVLLAVIGPRWLEIADEAGDRRLDNPNDFVRVEIATALRRRISVIPILLDGTKIPRVDRLPANLKGLARRNGLDVRQASFHSDVSRLVGQLKATIQSPAPLVDPDQADVARREITHLLATQTDYRALFEGIANVIRRFIEFDWADLSLYTRDGEYAVSLCRLPETSRDYPIRWWPIAPYFRKWINQKYPVQSDMLVDWKKQPDARKVLEEHPEIERVISSEGRRAMIALPMRHENRLIGVLSLSSKQRGIYDKSTFDLLTDGLAVHQALLSVFNLREHDERFFVPELLKKMIVANDERELARTIVSELARFYKFQNVSIFKVNAPRGHFSLLAQELGPEGSSAIPAGYTQPLEEGLLGLTLRRDKRVNLADRNDGSTEARSFHQVAPEIVSELCIPIRLRGRILWILNLEDTHANAFAEPEIETIEAIVGQVEPVVQALVRDS